MPEPTRPRAPLTFSRLLVRAQRRFEAGERALQIAARERALSAPRSSALISVLRPFRSPAPGSLRLAA